MGASVKYWAVLVVICFGFTATATKFEELDAILGQANDLNDFLGQPELVKSYQKKLKEYQHRDKFRCESFDRILQKIQGLKTKIPGFKERLWETVEGKPITIRVFRNNKKDEPPQFTTYTFRPAGRRFHGIFNDPSKNGCISEECDKNDPTSPDRWGILLSQSQLYYIEQDGMFADLSLLVTPISRKNETYGLITLGGGPHLTKTLNIEDPITKKKVLTSLLNVWLSEQLKNKKTFKSYATLDTSELGGKAVAEFPLAAAVGPPVAHLLGDPVEFVPADPIAKRIEKHAGRRCLAWTEGGRSIASQGKGKSILFGKTNAETDKLLEFSVLGMPIADPSDYKSVSNALSEVTGRSAGTLGLVDPAQTPALNITLSNILKDPDAEKRARAALALDLLNDRPTKKTTSSRKAPVVQAAPKENVAMELVKRALEGAIKDRDPNVRDAAKLALSNVPFTKPEAPFDLNKLNLSTPKNDFRSPAHPDFVPTTGPSASASKPSGSGSSRPEGEQQTPRPSESPRIPFPEHIRDRGVDRLFANGDRVTPAQADRFFHGVNHNPTEENINQRAQRAADFTNRTAEPATPLRGMLGEEPRTVAEDQLQQRYFDEIANRPDESAECEKEEKKKTGIFLHGEWEAWTKLVRLFASLENTAHAHEEGVTDASSKSIRSQVRFEACDPNLSKYLQPENGLLRANRGYFLKSSTSDSQDDCKWVFTDPCGQIEGQVLENSFLTGKFFLSAANDATFFLNQRFSQEWKYLRCDVKFADTTTLVLKTDAGRVKQIKVKDLYDREKAGSSRDVAASCKAPDTRLADARSEDKDSAEDKPAEDKPADGTKPTDDKTAQKPGTADPSADPSTEPPKDDKKPADADRAASSKNLTETKVDCTNVATNKSTKLLGQTCTTLTDTVTISGSCLASINGINLQVDSTDSMDTICNRLKESVCDPCMKVDQCLGERKTGYMVDSFYQFGLAAGEDGWFHATGTTPTASEKSRASFQWKADANAATCNQAAFQCADAIRKMPSLRKDILTK